MTGEETESDWLARRFEDDRRHLQAVAYRMLGSTSEANDAVQEAWLRLSRTDANENMGGWLTTVVGRVCLNRLRDRRIHREEPLSVHVPDPIVTRHDDSDPEESALLADSVGLALLVVLETLGPAERLAFVLHDLFAVPSDQIAPLIGRAPVAARQRPAGRPVLIMAFTVRNGKIAAVDALADRARLRQVDLSAVLHQGS